MTESLSTSKSLVMAMTVRRLYRPEAGSRLTPEPFDQKNEETTPKEKTPGREGKKGSVLEIENYFFILGIGTQGKTGEFMNSWTDPLLVILGFRSTGQQVSGCSREVVGRFPKKKAQQNASNFYRPSSFMGRNRLFC